MTYSLNAVKGYYWDFQTSPPFDDIANNWPTTFRYYFSSCWFEIPDEISFNIVQAAFNSNPPAIDFQEALWGVLAGLSNVGSNSSIEIQLGDGNFYNSNSSLSFLDIVYQGPQLVSNTWYNLIISVDSIEGIVQVFLNGVQLTTVISSNIFNSTTIAQPQGDSNGGSSFQLITGSLPNPGCVADAYWDAPSSFIDLTDPTNLAKFIGGSGNPIDLGTDGSIPFGISPLIYLTVRNGGNFTDFLTNRGTAGGTFYVPSDGPNGWCMPPAVSRGYTLIV